MEISLSLQQESKLSTLEQFREYDIYHIALLFTHEFSVIKSITNQFDPCRINGRQVGVRLWQSCAVWQTSVCCQRQCAAMLARVGKLWQLPGTPPLLYWQGTCLCYRMLKTIIVIPKYTFKGTLLRINNEINNSFRSTFDLGFGPSACQLRFIYFI